MPGLSHFPGGAESTPVGQLPPGEAAFLCVLLGLAVFAIAIEIYRFFGGRSYLSHQQFWMRMLSGALMVLVVLLITFGALFVRPEDGRIFAWFWAFCSFLLLIVLLFLRSDVARTRFEVRDIRLKMRDERLQEVKELIQRHRPDAGLESPPDSRPSSGPGE